MNVWAWDAVTGRLQQRTFFKELDCKNLSGGHGRLVFEHGGRLWTMDAAGGEARPLTVTLDGDFPWARPHWENVAGQLGQGLLSPSGKRAIFEARGEIFTIPAEKGDVRNLTRAAPASPTGVRPGLPTARTSAGSATRAASTSW